MNRFFFALAFAIISKAHAASFIIPDGTVETTPYVLSDVGDSGVIEEGGALFTTTTAITLANTNQTVFNSGVITTSGANANGIYVNGDNSLVVNCGTISSQQGYALSFNGTGNTLSLEQCGGNVSHIMGRVITEDDVLDVNVNIPGGLVLTLDDGGLGFGEITSNNPYIVLGNTLIVVDRTPFAWRSDFLTDLSEAVLGSVYQRRFGFGTCCESCSSDTSIWLQGIGSDRTRLKDNSVPRYLLREKGLLAGAQTALDCGYLGAFGGVLFGEGRLCLNSVKMNSTSYVGGVSFEHVRERDFFGAALALGYAELKNDRITMNNLAENGIVFVHSRSRAFFAAPELMWTRNFSLKAFNPNLTLLGRYEGLFFDSENIGVESSSVQQLIGSVECGLPIAASDCSHCFAFEPYVGGYFRVQLGDRRMNIFINEVGFSFDDGSQKSLSALFYGFRGSFKRGAWDLILNLRGSWDNHSSRAYWGQIGLSKEF